MYIDDDGFGDISEDKHSSSASMTSKSQFDTLDDMFSTEGREQCDEYEDPDHL